jgi:hypothetical protein
MAGLSPQDRRWGGAALPLFEARGRLGLLEVRIPIARV